MPTLFTVEDVAEKLHVNPQTVRVWIRAKTLHAAKIGRRYIITEDEFNRILREGVGPGDLHKTNSTGTQKA